MRDTVPGANLLSMDRRSALKKLGVGSAVAVSAPVILRSNAVAAGASQMPPASPLDAATTVLEGGPGNRTLTITISSSVFPAGTTVFWSYVSGPATNPTNPATLSTSVTHTGSGNFNNSTIELDLAATHPDGDTVDYRFTWASGSWFFTRLS